MWEGLYPKSLIDDLRFNEDFVIGEDTVFVYSVAKKADKLFRLPIRLYHYVERNESATHSPFNDGKMTRLSSWAEIIRLYEDDRACCIKAKATMAVFCWGLIRSYYRDELFKSKYYRYTIKQYRKYVKYYLLLPFGFVAKLKFVFIALMPKIALRTIK